MWRGPASVQYEDHGWPCDVCCAVTRSRRVASTPSLLGSPDQTVYHEGGVADTRKRRSR